MNVTILVSLSKNVNILNANSRIRHDKGIGK